MKNEPIEHLYHVYKMTAQNSGRTEFVADGPATRSESYDPIEPLTTYDADHLPKAVLRDHLYYLHDKGFDHISKSEDLYLSFSFNPPCQRVFRGGDFYSTDSLSQTEQDDFCSNLSNFYNSLDDIVDFKREGNPLL